MAAPVAPQPVSSSSSDPSPLWHLPAELINDVLSYLDPHHLIAFASTCAQARTFVRPNNKAIWRPVFLRLFEDPRPAWEHLTASARAANAPREKDWDWYLDLRNRLDARRIILSDDIDIKTKQGQYEDVVKTLLDIAETSAHRHMFFCNNCLQPSCRNIDFLKRLFENPQAKAFIHDFAYGPGKALPYLDDDPEGPTTRSMARLHEVPECASKLHLFAGPAIDEVASDEAKSNMRSIAYDWSIIGPESDYAPLNKDGSGTVNWVLLEAIASLMAKPLHDYAKRYTICPVEKPLPAIVNTAPSSPAEFVDWAGFSGGFSWMGTYAFLDYTDLAFYNYERERGERPELQGFEEAVGMLSLQSFVLDMALKDDPALQTTLPYCDDLPPLYFSGTTQSVGIMPQQRIGLRGCVMLCPGGKEVRWRFVVTYTGVDQWQIEGIQPGGIRTGPIYGTWTGCDHEENGPLGPFVYFMELDEPKRKSMRAEDASSGLAAEDKY